jgi:hypothetical protein
MDQRNGTIERAVTALTGWKQLTNAMERTLVDNLAATAPWLAPLAPAYMAYQAMINVLGFPIWIAFAIGGTIELLGISTINTALTFWSWNKQKNKSDPAAPMWLATAMAGFYAVIVLVVNVLLDHSTVIEQIAKALLSSLSILAAITLALRSQHSQRVETTKHLKEERKEVRRLSKVQNAKNVKTEVSMKLSRKLHENPDQPETFGKWQRWPDLPGEERLAITRMNVQQVMERYGIIERTAYNWIQNARKDPGVIGELARFQEDQEKSQEVE